MKNKLTLLLTAMVLLAGTSVFASTVPTKQTQYPQRPVPNKTTEKQEPAKDWAKHKEGYSATTEKRNHDWSKDRDKAGMTKPTDGKDRHGEWNKNGSHHQYDNKSGNKNKNRNGNSQGENNNNQGNNGKGNNGNAYGKNNSKQTYVNKDGQTVTVKKNPAQTKIQIKNK